MTASTLANKLGINLGQSDTYDLGDWEQSLSLAEREFLHLVGQEKTAAYEYTTRDRNHVHQKD